MTVAKRSHVGKVRQMDLGRLNTLFVIRDSLFAVSNLGLRTGSSVTVTGVTDCYSPLAG